MTYILLYILQKYVLMPILLKHPLCQVVYPEFLSSIFSLSEFFPPNFSQTIHHLSWLQNTINLALLIREPRRHHELCIPYESFLTESCLNEEKKLLCIVQLILNSSEKSYHLTNTLVAYLPNLLKFVSAKVCRDRVKMEEAFQLCYTFNNFLRFMVYYFSSILRKMK